MRAAGPERSACAFHFSSDDYNAYYENPLYELLTRYGIRTSGAFDAVIDLDATMRSSSNPLALNPSYDSGDHLHPSDNGYQAMANAVDLNLLNP